MRRSHRLAPCSLIVFLFLASKEALPSSDQAVAALESGRQALTGGNYVQAEKDITQALALGFENNATRVLATADLGAALLYQGRFDEAQAVLKRALNAVQADESIDRRYLPRIQANLGKTYLQSGNLQKAEVALKQALDSGIKIFGKASELVVNVKTNLGILHFQKGDKKAAEREFKQALSLIDQMSQPYDRQRALIYTSLATLYYQQQKWKPAEDSLLHALAITEQSLGSDHPVLCPTLEGLGVLYYGRQEMEKAENMVRRSLAIRRQFYHSDDRDTAIATSLLADILASKGATAEASELYSAALKVQERNEIRGSSQTAMTLEHFAKLLRRTNNDSMALEMETRARGIRMELEFTVPIGKLGR